MKVHMQNPDSNLAALNCADEYLLPVQIFNYGVLQIGPETQNRA